MPYVIKVPGIPNASGPILPTQPPLVPIPQIWNGLQFWLSADATSLWSAANLIPGDDLNVYWRNQYYDQLIDAAGRLNWHSGKNDYNGDNRVMHSLFSMSGNGTTNTGGLSLSNSLKINNRATLYNEGNTRKNMSVVGTRQTPDNTPDYNALAAMMTDAYTYIMVYHAAGTGNSGGIFGQSTSLAHDNALCGMRFGFASGAFVDQMLWQHKGSSADRLSIPRTTSNSLPTYVVITSANGLSGNLHIKNGGVASDHAFAFNHKVSIDPASVTEPALWVGRQDSTNENTANKSRAVGTFARLSRALGDVELTYLHAFMEANYGPF